MAYKTIAEKYAELGGESGRLGRPRGPEYLNPSRFGWRRQYEHGHIYKFVTGDAHVIYDGPIWEKFASLRWEQGMGYPTSDPITDTVYVDRTRVEIIRQTFFGGYIVSTPRIGTTIAFDQDGHLLPLVPYRLSLERIDCIEETDSFLGLGSDELRLRLAASTHILNYTYRRFRSYNSDNIDSGESRYPGITLFDGYLPALFSTTLFGVEAERESHARAILRDFERNMEAIDRTLFEVEGLSRLAVAGLAVSGAIVGIGIGAAVATASTAVTICIESSGRSVCEEITGEAAGALIGGASGLGIVLLTIAIVMAIEQGEKADAIMLGRTTYNGTNLLRVRDREVAIPEIIDRVPDLGITRNVTFLWESPNDLLVRERYRNSKEDSTYLLTFRHHFGRP